ncbi:MAG: cytochrome c oxidase assembly factor Coa1 family protein [Thermodesulfobacteriota bacterium]
MKKRYIKYIVMFLIIAVLSQIVYYFLCCRSDGYSESIMFLKNNDIIYHKIGKINKYYLFPFGCLIWYTGIDGIAEYKIILKGTKTNGTVYIKLRKTVGVWNVSESNLILENDEIVPLVKNQ